MSKQDDVALISEVCKTAIELLQQGKILEAAEKFWELELRCITLSYGLDDFENNLIYLGCYDEHSCFIRGVIGLCEEYQAEVKMEAKQ